jgi:hypothetical protein
VSQRRVLLLPKRLNFPEREKNSNVNAQRTPRSRSHDHLRVLSLLRSTFKMVTVSRKVARVVKKKIHKQTKKIYTNARAPQHPMATRRRTVERKRRRRRRRQRRRSRRRRARRRLSVRGTNGRGKCCFRFPGRRERHVCSFRVWRFFFTRVLMRSFGAFFFSDDAKKIKKSVDPGGRVHLNPKLFVRARFSETLSPSLSLSLSHSLSRARARY